MKITDEFVKTVIERLKERGIKAGVRPVKIFKNNMELEGISVSDDYKVGINYYPQEENFNMERMIDDIADQIMNQVKKIPAEKLEDRDFVLANIYPRLTAQYTGDEVNPLSKYAYVEEYMDMNISYYINLKEVEENEDKEMYTVPVTEELMKKLDIEPELMKFCSLENIRKITEFKSISQVMREMTGIDEFPEDNRMFVLTTKSKTQGAGALISDFVKGKIYEVIGFHNYYVLPSSVHEVLIIPDFEDSLNMKNVEEYYHMVTEVNATQVIAIDKLTDSVYYYTMEHGLEKVA